jgi:xylulokinase
MMGGLDVGERLRFHSMLSWIASQLVKPETYQHIVHTSDAASTGMFDVVNHDWHEEIIESVSVKGLTLPGHTSEVTVVGKSEDYKCLVFTPIGDQQSALLGIGLKDHQTAFNVATGGQVARIMHSYSPDVQVRPFYKGTSIVTKTHLPAGRALSYAIRLLSPEVTEQDSWIWASSAAGGTISTDELISNVQFFSESGGGWSGVSPKTTREDMIYSTIRAVADAYISAALIIGHEDGDDLVFCGGVAQKFKPLRDFITSSLNGNVIVAPEGESALRGLASVAKMHFKKS